MNLSRCLLLSSCVSLCGRHTCLSACVVVLSSGATISVHAHLSDCACLGVYLPPAVSWCLSLSLLLCQRLFGCLVLLLCPEPFVYPSSVPSPVLSPALLSDLVVSRTPPPQVINVDDDGNELGSGVMELTDAELVLHTHRRDDVRWPYLCLRRYGYDSNLFSFESGRRCQTGQGTNCCTVVLFVATYRQRAEVRTLKLPYT